MSSSRLVTSVADLERLADLMLRGGAFQESVRTAEQAAVVLLTGLDRGLDLTVAAKTLSGPDGPQPAAPPSSTPSALAAFEAALRACETLEAVVAAWRAHVGTLNESDATDAALASVATWMEEMGHHVTSADTQAILAGAWEAGALSLTDELAALDGGAVGIVGWWVRTGRARAAAELRDLVPIRRIVARAWSAARGFPPCATWADFAEAVKHFESGPEPIVTSKGVTLRSAEEVQQHVRAIRAIPHLESAARRHGAHPWAKAPLAERAAALLGIDPEDAAAQIASWATKGPATATTGEALAKGGAR